MSVKRTKDPAGLLPDQVGIDLTEPQPGDLAALKSMMDFNSPRSRIERLRRHESLQRRADELDQELSQSNDSGIAIVLADIAAAETLALYLDAAPAAIEKRKRLAARPMKVTDEQVMAAMRAHKTQERAAEALTMSARQLSTRLKQIKNRKS